MGGISGSELMVLLLVGFLVVGPEKLPELSKQFARVVRKVVAVARDTGDMVRAELGDDLDDLKSLDPRQYDPRRIVADAMKESSKPARSTSTTAGAAGAVAAAGGAAVATATPASGPPGSAAAGLEPAEAGRRPDPFDGTRDAPFDPDAT